MIGGFNPRLGPAGPVPHLESFTSRSFGGIGAFATISMTLNLNGSVVGGSIILPFHFNRTDGVAGGYRILALVRTRMKCPAAIAPDLPRSSHPAIAGVFSV
jgi:hypothetical protein